MKMDASSPDSSWQSSYDYEENQPQDETNTVDSRTEMERTWGLDVIRLVDLPLSRGKARLSIPVKPVWVLLVSF